MRPRLRRSASDRVIAGVAGGLAERLGIDALVLRLALVVLALAGGAGVVAYLALFLAMGWPRPEAGTTEPAAPPRTSTRQAIAIALVVGGILMICRQAGLWFGDGIVWPAALAVLGSAVIWTRGDGAHRARWLPTGDLLEGQGARVRAFVGIGLFALGAWALMSATDLFDNAPLAVAAVLLGLAVLAGPWVWRLVRQVADERRERIR